MAEEPKTEYWVLAKKPTLQLLALAFVLGLVAGMVVMVAMFGVLSRP